MAASSNGNSSEWRKGLKRGDGKGGSGVVVCEAGTYSFRGGTRRNFSRLFMDHHRRRLNFGGGHLPPTMLTIFPSSGETKKNGGKGKEG